MKQVTVQNPEEILSLLAEVASARIGFRHGMSSRLRAWTRDLPNRFT